ncbi:hypothetical protein MNV49_006887 [Pseudohyphozyma bogoriensis]|nr:hypothetical protein MNV49_006887 [Pseudohyphozyma bogoriensis]
MRASASRLAAKVQRTTPSPSTARLDALTSLYHQTSFFLPLSAADRATPILNTLVSPDRDTASPPRPGDMRLLVENRQLVELNARKGRVSLTQGGAQLDTMVSTTHINTSELAREGKRKLRDSYHEVFISGAEPVLRSRMRRIVETLHGTTAGGQAGPRIVAERAEDARKAREDWNKTKDEQVATRAMQKKLDKEREQKSQQQAEDFAREFESH